MNKRKVFKINDRELEIKIIYTNNKNLYLTIKNENVITKVPRFISDNDIQEFIEENSKKIFKELDKQRKNKKFSLVDNFIYILGKKYSITILEGFKNNELKLVSNNFFVNVDSFDQSKIEKLFENYGKSILKKLIEKIQPKIERIIGISAHEVYVINKNTAWATNYIDEQKIYYATKLYHFSPSVITYVIIHELCHAFIPNHSKEFWTLVEKFCPNYNEIRKSLKDDVIHEE